MHPEAFFFAIFFSAQQKRPHISNLSCEAAGKERSSDYACGGAVQKLVEQEAQHQNSLLIAFCHNVT